ncbi:MAG: hypothetical protein ACKVWR_11660 [Acidimicrobiales bacterium]
MPTYAWLARFRADFERLTPAQQAAFLTAVGHVVDDLAKGGPFRTSLRVKCVKAAAGIFEMTWAPDGRATFEYGTPIRAGDAHVIWRRVGTHSVFTQP